MVKRRDIRSRHVGVGETDASEPLETHRKCKDDIETRASDRSGSSMGATCLLTMELENLAGDDKGKGASGSPARPKLPRRQSGADCSVFSVETG
jgi:hypothetical protein